MPVPIVYVDTSDTYKESLPALTTAMENLAGFVKENEPQLLAYNIYLSEDRSRMSVVAIHPDSASLEFHMKLGGPLFAKFAEYIKLRSIDVYGEVSAMVMELLHRKATMLGGAQVNLHERYAGFARQNPPDRGSGPSWGLTPGDTPG